MDTQRASSWRDGGFWVGVVVLAALVRWPALAHWPLGPREADLAARAWDAALGQAPPAGPGGWLTAWLAGLFFLTGPTTLMARALPALAGALLPLVARAGEPVWGRRLARGVALGWALDPALVAASRLAWGPALALAWVGLAWAAYRADRLGWAGLAAVAALASGPSAGWVGLVLLALLWAEGPPRTRPTRRTVALLAVGLFLVVTVGLGYPAGLGGWAGGLVAWARGWLHGPGAPAAAGVVYLAPVLLWAAWGAWLEPAPDGPRRAQARLLAAGLVAGLWLAYPARQAVDLAWVSLLLWPWAAVPWLRGLEAVARGGRGARLAAGLAAGLLVLAGFAGLLVLAVDTWTTPDVLALALLVATGTAAGLMFALVAALDRPATAWQGVAWAGLAVTALALTRNLNHAWHAASGGEFWQTPAAAADVRALEATLARWGAWLARGVPHDAPGVLRSDDPVLTWLQRSRVPGLQPRQALMPDERPPLVLTTDPSPRAGYWGQRYRLWETPRVPPRVGWLRWWLYGAAERWVTYGLLWVRSDLGPAGNAQP